MRKHLPINIQLSAIIIVVFGLMLSSCSKLQNNALAPVQPQTDIHPVGWVTMASPDFHGIFIKSHNYDLSTCTSCHGNDFKGGIVGKSCYTCHQGSSGPLSCNTCHGGASSIAPPFDLAGDSLTTSPGVGTHQYHLNASSVFSRVRCSSCHVVPQAAGPGIHPAGTGQAILAFSGVATTQTNAPGTQFYDSAQPTVTPTPQFNSQTLQCSNTYCHGNFRNGNNFTPTWNNVNPSQAACGTCHDVPPKTAIHQIAFYQSATSQNCYYCHEPMMGPNGIQDSSLHVNGKLEVYNNSVSPW